MTIGRKVQKASEMETNWRIGILPQAGGWDDQDPDDIVMIRIASQVRGERQAINKQIQAKRKK